MKQAQPQEATGCGPCSGVVDFLYRSRGVQQFAALYRKNGATTLPELGCPCGLAPHPHRSPFAAALVAWRNRRATILRLLAPLLFLLLALLIDKAIQANDSTGEAYKDVTTPGTNMISPIPSCHDDLYIGSKDCIELVYAPNTSTVALVGLCVSRVSLVGD